MSRVFLTDAQQRKTLAVMRSLGRRGIIVDAGEETRCATALFSKYCRRAFKYPSPRRHPDEFLTFIIKLLEREGYDVLIPMDDHAQELIAQNIELISRYTRVPISGRQALSIASDKAATIEVARKTGVPHPRTLIIKDLEELSAVPQGMDFPLAIKPRKSSGARGMALVNSLGELEARYLDIHRTYPFPLIQEYIPPGVKYDVCFLLNSQSQLRAAFVQREIRNYPAPWGPATLEESVERQDLVELTWQLVKEMGLNGVLEVEYVIDPRSNKPVLMEINPRFWASVEMAILAGVDFPYLLYRLAMDGDIPAVMSYRTGLRCRWLLPGDIIHFATNPKRWQLESPFFDFRGHDTFDDTISADDPWPVLGFFLACLRYGVDPWMWRHFLLR